ncbi:hypothetical protein Rsub_10052 [Raphidocelis subcapitata]|uniref:RAP domain-containing protein n=1 Tax=Raphidocelis subcapitata TaxID=307507 RepID=A0A2V0PBF4_9CHLO|nr:hypothetical protein Rsub_10052 [Raphidocelis subcapitata]|eukprot:GBF97191.1 hypothetical protein Rsub_10052 [Raphidocelis subcapitata]
MQQRRPQRLCGGSGAARRAAAAASAAAGAPPVLAGAAGAAAPQPRLPQPCRPPRLRQEQRPQQQERRPGDGPAAAAARPQRRAGPDLSRPASEISPPGLTALISRSANWQEVAVLTARYEAVTNATHLCAALVRLAHVDGGGRAAADGQAGSSTSGGSGSFSSSSVREINGVDGAGSSSSSSSSGRGRVIAPRSEASTSGIDSTSSSDRRASPQGSPQGAGGVAALRPQAAPPQQQARPAPPPQQQQQQQQQQQPQPTRPANWRAFVAGLLERLTAQLPACGPRHLSNAIWAVARLGFKPDAAFMSAWAQRVHDTAGAATCRDASNALWALAALGERPAERLQRDLLSALHRGAARSVGDGDGDGGGGGAGGGRAAAAAAAAAAQDAANAAWAMARLGISPSHELLSALCMLLQRAVRQTGGGAARQGELAAFLWAVGEQHHAARAAAAEVAAAAAAEGLDWRANGGGGGWGFGAEASGPLPVPGPWLDEQLLRSARDLGAWRTQHLVMALLACARLRRRPPDAWLGGCLRALRLRLEDCSMQELSLTAASLGALRVCPMPDWTDAFVSATLARLPGATAQQLCMCAKGLARLRLAPPPEWWAAFEAAAAQRAERGAFSAAGLADVAAALALARCAAPAASPPPPPPLSSRLVAAWLAALEGAVPKLDARGLVKAAWAAARLGAAPHGALKRALASAAGARGLLRGLPTEDAVRLVWALVMLRVDPSPELANTAAAELCRRAGGMTEGQLRRAAWALARLMTAPRRELLAGFADLAEGRAAAIGALPPQPGRAVRAGGGGSGGSSVDAADGGRGGGSDCSEAETLMGWLRELRAREAEAGWVAADAAADAAPRGRPGGRWVEEEDMESPGPRLREAAAVEALAA